MKHIKLFIFPLVLLGIIFFSSCSRFERASVSVDKILSQSPDAVFELENLFENKKIIFVGSNDHNLINDVEFFDKKNLTKFYNKGLRYILFEGDVPTVEDDMLNNQVMIFYPWESVGVQYCENPILKNIAEINQNFIDRERIKVIGLEGGRQNFPIDDDNAEYIFNYRDSYMFNNVKKYIDNSNENDKFLILCGAAHGYKKDVIWNGFKWKTLGSHLEENYKNNFVSLDYVATDSVERDSIYYPKLKKSKKWFNKQFSGKFIQIEDIKNINKRINIFFDSNYELFDYFIVDKMAKYGIKYCYKLDDENIRNEVIQRTINIYETLIPYNYKYDYSNPEISYLIEELIRNIYYLKFQFGDTFNYSFWNPKTNLEEELNILKNIKTQKTYSDEDIKEYQTLIRSMYYIRSSISKKEALFYLKNGKQSIKEAKFLIPQEVWSDYWNAVMFFKTEKYTKALEACDSFINNPLAYSSQSLPQIFTIAIDCCQKEEKDSSFYEDKLNELFNELQIDIEKTHLFLY